MIQLDGPRFGDPLIKWFRLIYRYMMLVKFRTQPHTYMEIVHTIRLFVWTFFFGTFCAWRRLLLYKPKHGLMFVPFIIRRSRNNQHYALILPLLYSVYWLLYVSAVVCHHQSALSWEAQQTEPQHSGTRSHNHTLYDMPPIRFVFQVTQTDPRNSLMMADYCRNM
jgi:hypothetical protein